MSAVKRRKQKLGAGDRAFNIVLGGLTAVSVVVILYPLIFVLVASISDPMEIFQGNVWLWPKGFNLEAYKQVFRKGVIYLYNPHRSDIVYYGWNLDGHPRKDIHWQAAPVDPQFFGYIHHKTFVDDLLNGTNNSKTARDAFVPLQVVEAARRSFESGRIERVLGI